MHVWRAAWEAIPRCALGLAERAAGWPVLINVARFQRSRRPIILGPWVSEVGYELLYWVPFVRWVKRTFNLEERRLVVVSRGGTEAWYQDISRQYFDVFDFYSPEEFREHNEQRITTQNGEIKHWTVTAFDREVIAHVGRALGVRDVDVLHPSLMYRLFRLYWSNRAGGRLIERYTVPQRLARLPLSDRLRSLPASFTAVKFYFSPAFPATPVNQAFVNDVIRNLSEQSDVVVLNTGLTIDDHPEASVRAAGRIFRIDHVVEPRYNLALQTEVLSRARSFVGTYGGFSYLAPLLGVDAFAVYSERQAYNAYHLTLAQRVFAQLGGGSLVTMMVADVERLRMLYDGLGSDTRGR